MTWIVKPRTGACGNGIRLIQNPLEVATQSGLAVVQRYVSPYLLNGYKFDFRFYVLIAALDPFTVYLYTEGLARFCTHLYSPPTPDTLGDKFRHLTNTAVNVANKSTSHPILELASVVLDRIVRSDSRAWSLGPHIRQAVLLAIVAQYEHMTQNVGLAIAHGTREPAPESGHRPVDGLRRYFHLLGIDVMLDSRCEPVVLELNDRPSMCVTYPIERELKSGVVFDTLNIITSDDTSLAGRWEKLFPGPLDRVTEKVVGQVLRKTRQGRQLTPKQFLAQRLGYVPLAPGSGLGQRQEVSATQPSNQ
jgi:hypothetical protein